MAMHTEPLALYFSHLENLPTSRWQGRVTKIIGQLVESQGPFCSLGEVCQITGSDGREWPGEVVGFRGSTVLSMPLDRPEGIRYGDRITTWGSRPTLRVGEQMLGRVFDGSGVPLDSLGPYRGSCDRDIHASAPRPLERLAIRDALGTGIRAIDGFLACGEGQRLGIFGGSGVGKSTLIGMMARDTSADVTVLGLIGERGREVRHFLEDSLGEQGRKRSVVIVSTSDQSPLLRIRAAFAASTVAEYFCAQGKKVLLIVDSLTRMAMAQREIGLAAGEPPTAKGYTPSVLTLMARFIERAGKFSSGSITAFYTVLMEGDDQQDPLVDAARALLDGHIMLDRKLAARNHYPPIAILDSISRLMSSVASVEHLKKAGTLRRLLASYSAAEDLIRIGAYQKGADPELDRAITVMPLLNQFLQQGISENSSLASVVEQLLAIPG
ncbi:MAG TPA: FliI/YscN family ATPase [Terriglobales bacterium]